MGNEVSTTERDNVVRLELRNALKHILIHEFGMTKESIREQTRSYIKEIVDTTIKKDLEDLTGNKLTGLVKEEIRSELLRSGIAGISNKIRYKFDDLSHEVYMKLVKEFKLSDQGDDND